MIRVTNKSVKTSRDTLTDEIMGKNTCLRERLTRQIYSLTQGMCTTEIIDRQKPGRTAGQEKQIDQADL